MLFTRGTDYALRGLVYIARQTENRLVMANEIAVSEDMPEYFFAKILQSLAKSGLINSFRGTNGGFALAKAPEEITVLEVIEALEGPLTVSKCVNTPQLCEKSDTCPFHGYWTMVQQSLISNLNRYTLADAVTQLNANETQD